MSLLSCLLPSRSKAPVALPPPEQITAASLNTFLQLTFPAASGILGNHQAYSFMTNVFNSHARQHEPITLMNQVFNAARIEMRSGYDASILAWLQNLAVAVMTQALSANNQNSQPKNNQINQNNQNNHANQHGAGMASASTGGQLQVSRSLFFPSETCFKTLNSSQRSMDICVFTITDNDLANCIINAKKRRVNVRIITDDQQSESKGSDVIRLNRDFQIPLKFDNSPSHMHNKFAVIDGNVLVSGSYNWTRGARFDNRENIIITTDKNLVKEFSSEFERLWRQFS